MLRSTEPFPGWSLGQALERLNSPDELWRSLLEGRFVAFLQDCASGSALAAIDPKGWGELQASDLQLAQSPKTEFEFEKIRVFPLLQCPDADDRIAGSELSQVIFQYIFADPELVILSKRLLAVDNRHACVFHDGSYPGLIIDFKWPVDLSADSLAYDFAKPELFCLGDPPARISPIHQQTADRLVDRWQALRTLLAEGRAIAIGTFVRTGMLTPIARSQWRRERVCIDVRNGDLLEDSNGKPEPTWTGLVLELPEKKVFHEKPITFDSALSITTENDERPPKLTPAHASVRDAIKAEFPNGIPQNISVKERDRRIIEWQRINGATVVSSKTIDRYLKDIRL